LCRALPSRPRTWEVRVVGARRTDEDWRAPHG
jgi:hypothetical protein